MSSPTVRPLGDSMPLIAHLELTNRCNLRCAYCANRLMTRPGDDMSEAMLGLVMRRIDEAGIRQVILNTIGETLIAKHLAEAIASARARNLHILVSTNGQELDVPRAELLLRGGCDVVRISVNAVDPRSYRKLHAGGSFDRLLQNVRGFRALRDELGSSCELRVRSVLPPDAASREDLRGRLEAFWGEWADAVEFVTFGNMGGRNGRRPIADERRVRCATMWRGFNVMLDGRVAYCPCDFDGETAIGSLETHSFAEIWASDAFRSVRAAHAAHDFGGLDRCSRCDATRPAWYELKEPHVSARESEIMDSYLDGWREMGVVTGTGGNDASR